jgi:cytochrome c oxidase cbb3-type subunit 3
MPLRRLLTGVMVLAVMAGAISVSSAATEGRRDVDKTMSKPLVRGGVVYKSYCMLCHGERGDGMARATKLYGQMNLVIHQHPVAFYGKIIRDGGTAVGFSRYMPAWRDELTEEQIEDVIVYSAVVTDPVRRGEVVFKTNCILCHGIKGDGKGRAAMLYKPPPADLTRSDKNDEYKRMIITMGGKAMGRSEVMPVWGQQLTGQEIDDVVSYLRTLVIEP